MRPSSRSRRESVTRRGSGSRMSFASSILAWRRFAAVVLPCAPPLPSSGERATGLRSLGGGTCFLARFTRIPRTAAAPRTTRDREQAIVAAPRRRELQAERQAVVARADRDRERRKTEQRPQRAARRVAGLRRGPPAPGRAPAAQTIASNGASQSREASRSARRAARARRDRLRVADLARLRRAPR